MKKMIITIWVVVLLVIIFSNLNAYADRAKMLDFLNRNGWACDLAWGKGGMWDGKCNCNYISFCDTSKCSDAIDNYYKAMEQWSAVANAPEGSETYQEGKEGAHQAIYWYNILCRAECSKMQLPPKCIAPTEMGVSPVDRWKKHRETCRARCKTDMPIIEEMTPTKVPMDECFANCKSCCEAEANPNMMSLENLKKDCVIKCEDAFFSESAMEQKIMLEFEQRILTKESMMMEEGIQIAPTQQLGEETKPQMEISPQLNTATPQMNVAPQINGAPKVDIKPQINVAP